MSELLDNQEKLQAQIKAAARERAGMESRMRNTLLQQEAYKRCLSAADSWQEQILQRSLALLSAAQVLSAQSVRAAALAEERQALSAQVLSTCLEAAGQDLDPETAAAAAAAAAPARTTADDMTAITAALEELTEAMETAPPAFTSMAVQMLEDVMRDMSRPASAANSRDPGAGDAPGVPHPGPDSSASNGMQQEPGTGSAATSRGASPMPMEVLASTRRELRSAQSQLQVQQQELSVQAALRQQAEDEAAAVKEALASQKAAYTVQVGCLAAGSSVYCWACLWRDADVTPWVGFHAVVMLCGACVVLGCLAGADATGPDWS